MRKFSLPLLALAVCLMLSGTALAKGDKGNKGGSHGNGQGNSAQHHNGHDDADGNRPPGWDKGKKTGWGDCDVPPGQAKKQGCNSTTSRHHHHDKDHDRDRDPHRASTGTDNTGTHHTYTRRRTTTRTTTRPVTTTTPGGRQNPGGNSSIILQNNGKTTKGTAQKTAVGSQVQERKPAANPN